MPFKPGSSTTNRFGNADQVRIGSKDLSFIDVVRNSDGLIVLDIEREVEMPVFSQEMTSLKRIKHTEQR
ncbi:hypothetical protein GGI13_008144, partial [Coemansia sp. RSA 455]